MDNSPEDSPSGPVEPAATVSPPPPRPGVWSGLGTVALYFLLQLGIGVLAGVAIGSWLAFQEGLKEVVPGHKADIRALTRAALANPDFKVVLTVVTIAAAAAVIIAIVRQTWPSQWSRADLPGFGFVRPKSRADYPAAVLLGFAVVVVGGIVTHFLTRGQPVQQDVSVLAGKVSPGLRLLLVLLVVCVAPVVEELVFRGVLLSGLASRMRVGWAILVSALIFGAVHLPDFKFAWYPVPMLVFLGIVLAWLRIRTRSLWPSITLHATNNLVAILAWFFIAPHP